jgi:hypothetical protein
LIKRFALPHAVVHSHANVFTTSKVVKIFKSI